MGLAAAGVISFAAVAQAEEKPTHQVLTAVSSTALSGYVSTSVGWEPGRAVNNLSRSYQKAGDQFSLDVIDIKLSSALAEGEWASGYNVELWFGPDATDVGLILGNQIGSGGLNGGIAIKNANVTLNIPVGNGIQAKIGVFDTIVGYESANSIENPNYARSFGYTIEPTSHTGLLLSYKVVDALSISAGVANTADANLNQGARGNKSQHTWLASASLTAPDSLGFLKGAVLTAGVVDGFSSTSAPISSDQTLVYVGATLPTGIDKLSLGVAWDHLNIRKSTTDVDALAVYLSLKTCEKSTLNARVEYAYVGQGDEAAGEGFATTLTFDYKLWANVVSRLEYRWDHDLNAAKGAAKTPQAGPTPAVASRNNGHSLTAQIAYKF